MEDMGRAAISDAIPVGSFLSGVLCRIRARMEGKGRRR